MAFENIAFRPYGSPFRSPEDIEKERQVLEMARPKTAMESAGFLLRPILPAIDYASGLGRTAVMEGSDFLRKALSDTVFDESVVKKEDWQKALRGRAPSGFEYAERLGYNGIPKVLAGLVLEAGADPFTFTGIVPAMKYGVKILNKLGSIGKQGFKKLAASKADDAGVAMTKALSLVDDIGTSGTKANPNQFGFMSKEQMGEAVKDAVLADKAKYGTEGLSVLPSQHMENFGKKLQAPSSIRRIDRFLKKQGADPLSGVIRDYNLPGGGVGLERSMEKLKEIALAQNDELFTLPLADVKAIDFRRIFDDKTFERISRMSSKEIGTDAKNTLLEIQKWAMEQYQKTGGKISLKEAREYMQMFKNKIDTFAKQAGSNSVNDQAIKSLAFQTRKAMEDAVAQILTPEQAKNFRRNNKLLQTINSSEAPIYNQVTKEIAQPVVSQIDATMAGLGVGRLATGTPAVPILAGLAGKTLSSSLTDRVQTSMGRMLEKFGTGKVGKVADSTLLQVAKDIARPEPVEYSGDDEYANFLKTGNIPQPKIEPAEETPPIKSDGATDYTNADSVLEMIRKKAGGR